MSAVAADRGVRRPAWPRWLGPPALYLLLSLLLFGLPLLGGRRILASDGFDSGAFIWFLGWWPHAILHGQNPFITHAIFYPDGFNLTWAAALPGPAIVLAPITLLFGPATTYNLIELLAPALNGWAMFLLARELSGRSGPALVAGYLYGFSPYVLANLIGGPNLVLVWPLPLIVWLAIRRHRATVTQRAFIGWTAVLLIAQFLTAPEVLVTGTLFGAVALLAGALTGARTAVRALLPGLAGAYAIAGVLVSPFLAAFLLGTHYPPGATGFRADLASFILPPDGAAVRLHSGPRYVGSNMQTYLSVPLLALLGMTLWRGRRDRRVRVAGAVLGCALVAMLGSHLDVRGQHTGVWLPWSIAKALPVLDYAIAMRLALFAALSGAVLVAIGLEGVSRRAARRRSALIAAALAALSVVAILPHAGNRLWHTDATDPPFFTAGLYHRYLRSSDHVLTVPAWGPNERWVADAGYPFALSAGYAGNPFPPAYSRYPTWTTLLNGQLTPAYAAQLRRFLTAKRVTAILVEQSWPGPWRQLFGSLGVRPISVGGMWLYRL